MKIRRDDNVLILAGKDKGKTGKVLQTFPEIGKVVVEGMNMTTKHLKGSSQQKGKKIEYPAPINTSNIALVGKDGKAGRVGYEITKDGDKVNKHRVVRKAGKSQTL